MAEIIRRALLFAAAHAIAGGFCILIAYGSAEAGGPETEQPRFSTHAVLPFAPDETSVTGRFHAGTCDDTTALYLPDTDAEGRPVPPADLASPGGYGTPYAFGIEIDPLAGALDDGYSVELGESFDHDLFPLAAPLPPFAYGPCLGDGSTFVDK
jgi:hypothetical protein